MDPASKTGWIPDVTAEVTSLWRGLQIIPLNSTFLKRQKEEGTSWREQSGRWEWKRWEKEDLHANSKNNALLIYQHISKKKKQN